MFGFFGGGGFGGPRGGRFEARYRVYPVAFLEKPEAERGDKIFLPPSALDRLAQLHIEYPMLFEVENQRDGRRTHCGVLEFVSDEGVAALPYWMMQNLLLQEGDIVTIRSTALPKGTFVRLQPHSKDFLDITNPRAVLETTLRNFSCLTVGDTIPIHYNNKVYYIDIVEAKPSNAISVIETDCQVDFAPPLDYVEPEPTMAGSSSVQSSGREVAATEAVPMATESSLATNSAAPGESSSEVIDSSKSDGPTFLAFSGKGYRLDGKQPSGSRPVAIPAPPGIKPSDAPSDGTAESGSAPKPGSSAGRKAGKLMFRDRLAAKYGGGSAGDPNRPGESSGSRPAASDQQPSQANEDNESGKPAFKSFSGKSYSLKG